MVAVPVTVNRHLVPAGDYLFEPAGVAFYLLPDDEERGPRLVLLQQPEESAQPAVRAVVEGQCHRALRAGTIDRREQETSLRDERDRGRRMGREKGGHGGDQ